MSENIERKLMQRKDFFAFSENDNAETDRTG